MSTHCFFTEDLREGEELAVLSPEESRHLAKVLRLKTGDEILLLNGNGLRAAAEVTDMGHRGEEVTCRIKSMEYLPPSSPSIRLYIAPPKGKNMDLLLKEATELGVSRITPVICRYSVSKPDECKSAWRQHLLAACKQSRNPWLPEVDVPMSFDTALAQAGEMQFLGAVPRPGYTAGDVSPENARNRGAALWIGPEGGFSDREEEALFNGGAIPLTIGRWILRVETAVPALLGAMHAILKTTQV